MPIPRPFILRSRRGIRLRFFQERLAFLPLHAKRQRLTMHTYRDPPQAEAGITGTFLRNQFRWTSLYLSVLPAIEKTAPLRSGYVFPVSSLVVPPNVPFVDPLSCRTGVP